MSQHLSTHKNPYGPLLAAAIGRIIRKKGGLKKLSTEQRILLFIRETAACRDAIISAIRSSPVLRKQFKDLSDEHDITQNSDRPPRSPSSQSIKATSDL